MRRPEVKAAADSEEMCDEDSCLVCSTMCAPLSGENGKTLFHLCSLALIKKERTPFSKEVASAVP